MPTVNWPPCMCCSVVWLHNLGRNAHQLLNEAKTAHDNGEEPLLVAAVRISVYTVDLLDKAVTEEAR